MSAMENLPEGFIKRFYRILPEALAGDAEKLFSRPRPLSVRINTLKAAPGEVQAAFVREGIDGLPVPWCPEALILPSVPKKEFAENALLKNGLIYIQGLSSLIPVIALDPQPGERILDMCAAPGSKATQIAARMQNNGDLVCLEAIRPRFFRLKSVTELLGVRNGQYVLTDARRYRAHGLFDRILLDAPCSSEGRFLLGEKESFHYWSPRKIKEMCQKQRGLILHAGRMLKPGGVLVYSTCTFAPEENEGVVDWFLRKTGGEFFVDKIAIAGIPVYACLTAWEKKNFDPQVRDCLRVLPDQQLEGFFIARLKKR